MWVCVLCPVFLPAGYAQTSGGNRPADGENHSGASRPGSVLLRGEEGSGLCSGPERGPPPLSAAPAWLSEGAPVSLLTSRGQKHCTEWEEEGALSLSCWGVCCGSELKFLKADGQRKHDCLQREKLCWEHLCFLVWAKGDAHLSSAGQRFTMIRSRVNTRTGHKFRIDGCLFLKQCDNIFSVKWFIRGCFTQSNGKKVSVWTVLLQDHCH